MSIRRLRTGPRGFNTSEQFFGTHSTWYIARGGCAADEVGRVHLPIIQRLGDKLNVPVISSNIAMIWNILSKLGAKFSIKGYAKLLSSWPVPA